MSYDYLDSLSPSELRKECENLRFRLAQANAKLAHAEEIYKNIGYQNCLSEFSKINADTLKGISEAIERS